ncbi:hypothetical protein DL96DRAFT_1504299 [Flagelloscypha sp. PMI_526]|nr:hypothetical protein DL96DRAFT_1504299 [Flagelloscypha sp. PMI_526]
METIELPQRPNSRIAGNIHRHGNLDGKTEVDEFESFKYDVVPEAWPRYRSASTADLFALVQFHTHLNNENNFSEVRNLKCLVVDSEREDWLSLDERSVLKLLESVKDREATSPPTLYAFFVPVTPKMDSSFGNSLSLPRDLVIELFKTFDVDPEFILNFLGRPDYWAPVLRRQFNDQNMLLAYDYSCQHPRWNLEFQGAPLSVYMRYNCQLNTILYLISHREADSSVSTLENILRLSPSLAEPQDYRTPASARAKIFVEDPFHLHLMFSILSFEAAKYHIGRFRRFMWTNINVVDDHLAGLIATDRKKLGELTVQLQVMSQKADSLIGSADVAIISGNGIRKAHQDFHCLLSPPTPKSKSQQIADKTKYIVQSFEKQKIWLLNYRARKDSTMGLVYNLVTQQDAANNIGIAVDMRRDSASMSSIALLTMLFLPATFTATLLGSGIFSSESEPSSKDIKVSNFWWFWLVLTVPLTVITIISWVIYSRKVVGKLQKI